MNKLAILPTVLLTFCLQTYGQTRPNIVPPEAVMVRILMAEDRRQFDEELQALMKSPDAAIRKRAVLAAGRIGDEKSAADLIAILEKDRAPEVRATAAFALGEIESAEAGNAILRVLANDGEHSQIRARAVEAAGKIAAANPKNEKSTVLSNAILNVLQTESAKPNADRKTVLLGLTAVLRARPANADSVLAKFLTDKDARVRADAANALVRLRTKNETSAAQSRAMLASDSDAVARANAARVLGAAEDKQSVDLLIKAATGDADQRVRVSAIRALASLKDTKAAPPLLDRGEKLLAVYKTAKSKFANPAEKNELLEIVAALGRLSSKSGDVKITGFLGEFRLLDRFQSPETEIAMAQVSLDYLEHGFEPYGLLNGNPNENDNWRICSSLAQGYGELSKYQTNDVEKKVRVNAENVLREPLEKSTFLNTKISRKALTMALPDVLRAFAAFKTDDLSQVLRKYLQHEDVNVRAVAAELLGEQPGNEENIAELKTAFAQSLERDIESNDATLAILSALAKLDKEKAVPTLMLALNTTDYIVRRHAANLVKANNLGEKYRMLRPEEQTLNGLFVVYGINNARNDPPVANRRIGKLGLLLNNYWDYARSIRRRNGQTKAVVTTEKGAFTIDLLPEDAPLTVENFIKLAKSNYFNGTAFHRVVPNFVVQGGDPRGDGNGGPGWQIRDEINMVEYERGAVGMALSGKDTGGSQWFVTHSPQPHLDGGYTVFGRVNESDMKIVDRTARGDKILSVRVIENSTQRRQGAKTQRKIK